MSVRNYKDFVEGADVKTVEDLLKKVIGGFLLGDSDFVNWVKEAFLSGRDDEKEIPILCSLFLFLLLLLLFPLFFK